MKRILGIDPGSINTGFGVLDCGPYSMKHIEHGLLSSPSKLAFNARIVQIGGVLGELFERTQPDTIVLEKAFLGKNPDSAFKIGHLRGIIIYHALRAGAKLVEYAPRSIKKGVTGNGASTKEHVRMLLCANLQLQEAPALDASDALAMAFYHATQWQVQTRLREREGEL